MYKKKLQNKSEFHSNEQRNKSEEETHNRPCTTNTYTCIHVCMCRSINKNSETRTSNKTPDVLDVLLWPHHIHFISCIWCWFYLVSMSRCVKSSFLFTLLHKLDDKTCKYVLRFSLPLRVLWMNLEHVIVHHPPKDICCSANTMVYIYVRSSRQF